MDGIKKMAVKGRKYDRCNMDGRKLPRGRYTTIPVEKEERCPFRMTIYDREKQNAELANFSILRYEPPKSIT
jgi:hypothetical protein